MKPGPTRAFISFPDTVELLGELSSRLLPRNSQSVGGQKNGWCGKAKKWHQLPSGLWGGISTPLFFVVR